MLHRFTSNIEDIELPKLFTYPFHYTPHPLCRQFDIKWIGDKDGNFITQIDESVTNTDGEVITTVSEKLFVLKGIRASFVSETGYSSYIITDLGIKVPEYDFTEVKSVTDMTKIEPVRMTDCIIYINWKRY